MPDFLTVPIPGSARARLLAAGIARFQDLGFERASVVEIALDAGVTTGSLYHHFRSKLGLYVVIRDEMEKRMTERMEGAASALGSTGRPAIGAGLEVAFDAAVRFGVTRILAEPRPDESPDTIALLLSALVPHPANPAGAILAAAWRAALLAVADGVPAATAKEGMRWVLNVPSAA
jgi:AcrR family transcriptional regulator